MAKDRRNSKDDQGGQVTRTFELDDLPHQFDAIVRMLDTLRWRFPKFRANLFCVPTTMTERQKDELASRSWVRMYPHGFEHRRGECRRGRHRVKRWGPLLDAIAADDRWGRVFKAPWHGYSWRMLKMLHQRGFASASTHYAGWPLPMPAHWRTWNLHAQKCLSPSWSHIEAHPPDNIHYALSWQAMDRWSARWSQDDDWAFVEDLLRPALVKANLGCGPHVWDGWYNLDPRAEIDSRIIRWSFDEMIPIPANQADIVFTSHVFNYVADEKYEEALVDIWRVLRPGGVLRMSEDATDSGYVWRRPGQGSRGTGEIQSLPTRERLVEALRRVGFQVFDATPESTRSPHKDVLKGNSRSRRYQLGHKYYLEAVKEIEVDVSRPLVGKRSDPRATRRGRWKLPG